MDALSIAMDNLASPMVLCFALGLIAALARSELTVPEAAAKAMSLYLLLAIGFKGGVAVSRHGLGADVALAIGAGVLLSLLLPVIAFYLLRWATALSRTDAAAVGAHYGSISIVTFVAATQALEAAGMSYEGYMVAVAAAMEAPAIVAGLWLASGGAQTAGRPQAGALSAARAPKRGLAIPREVYLNGSIVLLVGAFVIGWISGEPGFTAVAGFLDAPFKGVLCLFLLDMGLLAGRHLLESARQLDARVLGAGLVLPLVGAAAAAPLGWAIGLSAGGLALLITLAASASYIAAPAALRIALPQANPATYLTLSLGVTFPFNLTLGIPLYLALAQALA
ncbi:MAG: sodium-dependent bicarbonate transport family permease [Pseudomonadota bacterium]